jgi:hypothetical protein
MQDAIGMTQSIKTGNAGIFFLKPPDGSLDLHRLFETGFFHALA